MNVQTIIVRDLRGEQKEKEEKEEERYRFLRPTVY